MHIQIYGIRHHGPGSAKRLQAALRQFTPDALVIELPQDAEPALSYIGDSGLRPPVALLLYQPKDFSRASYLPFATFSPEWLALRYANQLQIPVYGMDLPMAVQLQLDPSDDYTNSGDRRRMVHDPLGQLATLAGYSDSERWWEHTFEREIGDTRVFPAILQMIRQLRSELPDQNSLLTKRREAHMRKVLRRAVKAGHQRIAVVCGAWHGPALADYLQVPAGRDNKLLQGLPKKKIKVTWVPWSYDRIARDQGYAAGVIAPAWYELLFSNRKAVSIRWMIKAARLLRQKNADASAAQVVDAVRLAETLAAMRDQSVPGLEELEEAVEAVFAHGNAGVLAPIRRKLRVGDTIGKIPPGIPTVPLQQDFERMIKSARLSAEYQTTERVRKALDLRKASNLMASRLLHRLLLLGIPWGKLLKTPDQAEGRFAERWSLKWRADYAIRLIEAGMWGNTVQEAATQKVISQTENTTRLIEFIGVFTNALKADLPDTTPLLLEKMKVLVSQQADLNALMEALPPLINIYRYGSTQGFDSSMVEQVIRELVPRIAIGLPTATVAIQEDVAKVLFQRIVSVNQTISLLEDPLLQRDWETALLQVSRHSQAFPLLQGLSTRLVLDKNLIDVETAGLRLAFALSALQQPLDQAGWVAGFLHGSGLLFTYHPNLWPLLTNWVEGLPADYFQTVLPQLRRAFSQFSRAERRAILQLAAGNTKPATFGVETTLNPEYIGLLRTAMQRLLGN